MKTLNGSMKTVALSSPTSAGPAMGLRQHQLGKTYGKGRMRGSQKGEHDSRWGKVQGSGRECAK